MPDNSWKPLYPFESQWMTTSEGHKLHYVETPGDGVPAVMLHGNPTWSFMYRNLLRSYEQDGRKGIAIDNLGCGLSDKPQDWPYHLRNHVANFTEFVEQRISAPQFDLVLHDWGGGIGMGYAVANPQRIRRIVLMNTAAYLLHQAPRRIALAHIPLLGALMVRGMNLFVNGAIHMAPAKRLPAAVKAGLRHPYRSWHDRVAVLRFVQDIPVNPKHPTWDYLRSIEERLPVLADKPIMLCWGEQDFCFGMEFFHHWKKIYPNCLNISFPDAAHYLLEDKPEQIIPVITRFLQQTEVTAPTVTP